MLEEARRHSADEEARIAAAADYGIDALRRRLAEHRSSLATTLARTVLPQSP